MEKQVQYTEIIEKNAVFSNDKKKRYELTVSLQKEEKRSIFVLCHHPSSDSLLFTDDTTNILLNNLFSLGYTTITICNLFPIICNKLTNNIIVDDQNISYLEKVLKRNFETVLIAYGITRNRNIREAKVKIDKLLRESGKKIVELKDEEGKGRSTIHPLYAGRHFTEIWEFKEYTY